MNFIIQSVFNFLLMMWQHWSELVIAPFNTPNLLWIVIPIWITWFFTERYQELSKTSLGNAITNGAVVLWVSIDWIRMLVRILTESSATFDVYYAMKFGLASITFTYGSLIIFYGIRKKKFIHYFGRIREITYVMITFSPMIYGIVDITWQSILSIFFFFPLFYFLIEIFNVVLPKPKTYEEDEDKSKNVYKSSDLKHNPLLDNKLDGNNQNSFADSLKINNNISNDTNNVGINNNSNNNPLSDISSFQPSDNMNNNLQQQPFSNEQNFSQNNNFLQQPSQDNQNNFEQNGFQQNNNQQDYSQNNNSVENVNNNNNSNNNNNNNGKDNINNHNNKRKSRFSDLPQFDDEDNEFQSQQ